MFINLYKTHQVKIRMGFCFGGGSFDQRVIEIQRDFQRSVGNTARPKAVILLPLGKSVPSAAFLSQEEWSLIYFQSINMGGSTLIISGQSL